MIENLLNPQAILNQAESIAGNFTWEIEYFDLDDDFQAETKKLKQFLNKNKVKKYQVIQYKNFLALIYAIKKE